jgi:hypothetical protein
LRSHVEALGTGSVRVVDKIEVEIDVGHLAFACSTIRRTPAIRAADGVNRARGQNNVTTQRDIGCAEYSGARAMQPAGNNLTTFSP